MPLRLAGLFLVLLAALLAAGGPAAAVEWVVGGGDASARMAVSDDALDWDDVPGYPLSPPVWDAAHGGIWIAVGPSGSIATSTFGLEWTARPAPTSEDLRAIAYGDGTWIAVGDNGKVLRSTDAGRTWSNQSYAYTGLIRDVAYGQDVDGLPVWVAVGADGVAVSRNDGLTWQARGEQATGLYGIAYGDGTWLAFGQATVVASQDTSLWVPRGVPPVVNGIPIHAVEWRSADHGNGTWVLVGRGDSALVPGGPAVSVLRSTDGAMTWSDVSGAYPFGSDLVRSVKHHNGTWVAAGNQGVALSIDDGENWSPPLSFPTWPTPPTVRTAAALSTHPLPDPVHSSLSVTPGALVADGTATAKVHLVLRDASNVPIGHGGHIVGFAVGAGTLGPVTDHGNGSYSAVLTAPTAIGATLVEAAIDGQRFGAPAAVEYVAGPPSTKNSFVEVAPAVLTADGQDTALARLHLRDAHNNPLPHGIDEPVAFWLPQGQGSLSAATDGGDGTYSALLSAPTVVGTALVSAMIDGGPIVHQVAVDYVAGPPDASNSILSVQHSTLVADGQASTTAKLVLHDAHGNAVTTGGHAVQIGAPGATLAPATDHGDGTYTTTLTAPTQTGSTTLSATVLGQSVPTAPTITFVAGPPMAGTSLLTVQHSTLVADGQASTTAKLVLHDAHGNAVTTGGHAVQIHTSSGDLSAFADAGDGTYTATLTAPTQTGSATVTATVHGDPVPANPSVAFIPGPPSTQTSVLDAAPKTAVADGNAAAGIHLALRDPKGNPVGAGGHDVAFQTTRGTIAGVTDHGDGTYTALLRSGTAGAATVGATLAGAPLAQTVQVQFHAGPVDAAASTLDAAPASVRADGADAVTLTATLRDAQGNLLHGGGHGITFTTSLGTIAEIQDHGDGTYTALLRSTGTGRADISAAAGQTALTQTAHADFYGGPVDPAVSSIRSDRATVAADGVAHAKILVELRDAQGNLLHGGGHDVTLGASHGSLTTISDHGDGTYTAKLTATSTGTTTIHATVDGQVLDAAAEVVFVLPFDAAKSSLSVDHSQAVADGTDAVTVLLVLRDANGDMLTTGGHQVHFGTTRGSIDEVQDHGDGTYTALLRSTRSGNTSVNATVQGTAIPHAPTVAFMPGPPSPEKSTLTAERNRITADGKDSTALLMVLHDAHGNRITAGGPAVHFEATHGAVAAATDHGDGTYTTTLTAPTLPGNTSVRAYVDGQELAQQAVVALSPFDPVKSTLRADRGSMVADGIQETGLVLELRDSTGDAVALPSHAVTLAATLGSLGGLTAHGNGTYSAVLGAGTRSGTATVTAHADGYQVQEEATVRLLAGPMAPGRSLLKAEPETVPADGTPTTLTLTLRDAHDNVLDQGGSSAFIQASMGTIDSLSDNNDGTYTATLSSFIPGTATVTATVGATIVAEPATVTFTPVPVPLDAGMSTLAASPTEIPADGTSTTLVTLILRGGLGQGVFAGGHSVSFSSTHGSLGQYSDAGDGTYTIRLTAPTTPGTAAVTATVDGTPIEGNATITFTAVQDPPSESQRPAPDERPSPPGTDGVEDGTPAVPPQQEDPARLAFLAETTEGSALAFRLVDGPRWMWVQWDFGDGSDPVAGPEAAHTYNASGVYNVTVTAMDEAGTLHEATRELVVTRTEAPLPVHDDGAPEGRDGIGIATMLGLGGLGILLLAAIGTVGLWLAMRARSRGRDEAGPAATQEPWNGAGPGTEWPHAGRTDGGPDSV